MSDMKGCVVTVSVEANVGGHVLGVQAVTISNGINDIPAVELLCPPTEASLVPLDPNVSKPTIIDFCALYRDLYYMAEGLETRGYVTIIVNEGGREERLDLRDWILSGVSLSSISSTGAPFLSVVLSHPICLLTKVGSIYETPKTDIMSRLNHAVADAEDFLDVVKKTYEFAREKVAYWPVPDGNMAPERFRKALGTGDFDPSRYLVFKKMEDEGGIIFEKGAPDAKARFAQAAARMALPMTGGSSTWDMIVGAAGSQYLSIVQDEEHNYMEGEQLVLEPCHPWKKADVTLVEERCSSVSVPGQDSFRLIGVMAAKRGPYNDAMSQGLLKNGLANLMPPVGNVLYSPVDDPGISDGRIMIASSPEPLDSAFMRDAPSGKVLSQGIVFLDKVRKDGYNRLLEKYCKAVYEMSVASMVRAQVDMALSFRDVDGHAMLPGRTCVFRTQDKALYYGYITNVAHDINVEGGCHTVVAMSHVRPEEDFKVKGKVAIAAGSPNAMYS